MSKELKPVRCGCGGEAKISTWTGTIATIINDCNVVYCETCGMQTKRFKTEAEAIEAWNRVMGNRDDVSQVIAKNATTTSEMSDLTKAIDLWNKRGADENA